MSKPAPKLYIVAVVLAVLIWVGGIAVGGFFMGNQNGEGGGIDDLGRDLQTTNRSEREDWNYFEITPASWAFSIWFLIYSWQAVFFLYCILSIFQKFDLHRVPMLCFPFYTLTNLGGLGWQVCSGQDWYWPGVGCITAMPFAMIVCSAISLWKSDKKEFTTCKYFIYTYMVHNAFAIYAGWTTAAKLLWLGITMIHGSPAMGQQITGTIMLGILMGELVLFCALEHTVLEKYLRHVWGHYIALAVAVSGSIIQNFEPHNRNSIMTVAIAGFVVCSFLLKVVRMMYCKHYMSVSRSNANSAKYLEAQQNGKV